MGSELFSRSLASQGEGHVVNTASIAGLNPGCGPIYAASKHAVVAISEELFKAAKIVGLPVGVSVLCPGWVQTGIMDADRNWPARLGESPPPALASEVTRPLAQRAIDEGMPPATVADLVADAIVSDKFWVLPHPEFVELAVRRWQRIAEGKKSRSRGRCAWIPAHHAMGQRDSGTGDGADGLGGKRVRLRGPWMLSVAANCP
jgi:short-subunit dehydrogenase